MEVIRCANMNLKNFFNFISTPISKFDTFEKEPNRRFLKNSFMLGISNFEKIFKGGTASKIKVPIFCHGLRFNKAEIDGIEDEKEKENLKSKRQLLFNNMLETLKIDKELFDMEKSSIWWKIYQD